MKELFNVLTLPSYCEKWKLMKPQQEHRGWDRFSILGLHRFYSEWIRDRLTDSQVVVARWWTWSEIQHSGSRHMDSLKFRGWDEGEKSLAGIVLATSTWSSIWLSLLSCDSISLWIDKSVFRASTIASFVFWVTVDDLLFRKIPDYSILN